MNITKRLLPLLIAFFSVTLCMAATEKTAVSPKDVALSTEAKKLFKMAEVKSESEGYLFLLGIRAAPEDDPVEVGKKLLAEYRKIEQDHEYRPKEYPKSKEIKIPLGELYCAPMDVECQRSLFKLNYNIDEIMSANKVIIDRVEKLHRYNKIEYPTSFAVAANPPFYTEILFHEKIVRLKAIALSKSGKHKEAVDLLLSNIDLYRKHMAINNDFVGKLICVMAISDNLDVLSIIISSNEGTLNIKKIKNLSRSEKDFQRAIAGLISSSYQSFLIDRKGKLGDDKVMSNKYFKVGKNTPFLPNVAINSLASEYKFLRNISLVTPKEFADIEGYKTKEAKTKQEKSKIDELFKEKAQKCKSEGNVATDHMANCVMSRFFADVSIYAYKKYLGELMDLDASISVFNQLYVEKKPISEIRNPYYSDKFVYKKDGEICFDGPLKDEKGFRCLTIAK